MRAPWAYTMRFEHRGPPAPFPANRTLAVRSRPPTPLGPHLHSSSDRLGLENDEVVRCTLAVLLRGRAEPQVLGSMERWVRAAPLRDVVCIGAADGCLLPLARLIAQLPLDFAAAVFVAFRPSAVVQVVDVLRRCAALPVAEAMSEEWIASGRVRVGPRDRQLRLTSSKTKLDDIVLERTVRPSIDVLFGSAASRLGRRVIGVLIGGGEGDGSEGARAIHSCGGLIVVPRAAFASGACLPTTPSSACRPDYVVPLADVGALLVQLVAAAGADTCAHPFTTRALHLMNGAPSISFDGDAPED